MCRQITRWDMLILLVQFRLISSLTDLKPEDEITALRDETKLLHNLMIYERHRREILGIRNRRLLGKTKSSRILEEQNTALKDQLTTMYRDVQLNLAPEKDLI